MFNRMCCLSIYRYCTYNRDVLVDKHIIRWQDNCGSRRLISTVEAPVLHS